jgi:hypothetical protein
VAIKTDLRNAATDRNQPQMRHLEIDRDTQRRISWNILVVAIRQIGDRSYDFKTIASFHAIDLIYLRANLSIRNQLSSNYPVLVI